MNGVVIIDKPKGITSHGMVKRVKKALGVQRAGHVGTLDPLATGVLPVCLNEGTKLAPFFSNSKKEYRATMILGLETDTYDVEGKILSRREISLSRREIEDTLLSFQGVRRQIVPPYSAVKHHGVPLYRWTRRGFNLPPLDREVEIYEIELLNVHLPYVTFRVSCSKGTYIRSLCKEIGEVLGCGAVLCELRRLRSGNFSEDMALVLPENSSEAREAILASGIISLVDALPELPQIEIEITLAKKIRQGHQPEVQELYSYHIPFLEKGDMVKFIYSKELVALAEMLYPSSDFRDLVSHTRVVKLLRVFKERNNN